MKAAIILDLINNNTSFITIDFSDAFKPLEDYSVSCHDPYPYDLYK